MAVLAIKIIFHKKEFLKWKKKLVIKIKKADDGGGRDPSMGRRRSNLIFSGWRNLVNSQAKGLSPDVTLESSCLTGQCGTPKGKLLKHEVISQVKGQSCTSVKV